MVCKVYCVFCLEFQILDFGDCSRLGGDMALQLLSRLLAEINRGEVVRGMAEEL